MNKERRKSIRIKKQIDAQYQHIINDKTVWITVLVNDISEAGACVLIDRFPLIGEEIILRLRTPLNPGEWLQVNTKVIDVDKYMTNTYFARLHFIDLQVEYKERIREYIDFYLKREKRL
ncbi:MAG: PilZ domain-containing protein [Candidatus Omnitrophota bacterium]